MTPATDPTATAPTAPTATRSATAEADADPQQTAAALRRLAAVAGVLCAVLALSYLVPALSRYRPWVVGEGLPVLRMFVGEDAAAALPSFAEAGALWQPSGPEAGDTGAPQASPDVGDPAPGRDPQPGRAPGLGDADGDDASAPRSANAGTRVSPEEYAGVTQLIEQPQALQRFFAALARSAAKKPQAITRVAHYGDSAVAADQITRTLRRLLQVRFGDAGHGFILVSRGDMHYAHRGIYQRASDGWELDSLVRDSLRGGWYGYGGVLGQAGAGEYASLQTVDEGPVGRRVGRIEVFYQAHPRGGKLLLSVDGQDAGTVDTRAPERADAWKTLKLDTDGPHAFRLRTRGRGRSHVYGVAFERDVPGVVYDSLGLVGARAQRLLNADAAHMQRQIAHRRPDLLVLAFGGNEAGNKWLDIDRYREELVEVVKQMRAGRPEMDCLLFGPLDQGEIGPRGAIVTLEKLPPIVQAQREVAKAHGCAFYDTFTAMGGEGSVRQWYKRRPRLVTSDFRHATPKGYEVIGGMYYKALLRAFADYLAQPR